MRILIFHGYLLHGTGSNVFNAELAKALVQNGHEVHLLCQDRAPQKYEWVDAIGDWDSGSLNVQEIRSPVHITVYRPAIGDLLPVYVADRYEGITAKPFPELSESELDNYIESNVEAVKEVCHQVNPDVALANHLVMGPCILSRGLGGSVPYAVKIHGSALEYTVKPYPRFFPYAVEGLNDAKSVLVGSSHVARELLHTMGDDELAGRVRLAYPGVSTELFKPQEREAAIAGLGSLQKKISAAASQEETSSSTSDSTFFRRSDLMAKEVAQIDPNNERLVVYVGKFIASKGVDFAIATWPQVLQTIPNARLMMVGFGEFEPQLRQLTASLTAGNLAEAMEIRSEKGQPLKFLRTYLQSLTEDEEQGYINAAAKLDSQISWLGRLEHGELADLLPAAESILVPSVFPEAFGMVAIEGAACGAFPIVADQSGLAETAKTFSQSVPSPASDWLTFDPKSQPIRGLGNRIVSWLSAPGDLRTGARSELLKTVRTNFSWNQTAEKVVLGGLGQLDALAMPDLQENPR